MKARDEQSAGTTSIRAATLFSRPVWLLVLVGTPLSLEAEQFETLELRAGKLRARLRDNSASPGILSGLQSLFHASCSDFDAYDPDGRGSSAGLNFEHIISGHRSPSNRFTPRDDAPGVVRSVSRYPRPIRFVPRNES